MFDFFQELFGSEIVKNNKIAIIAAIIFFIVLGGVVVFFYMKFFFIKSLKKKNDDYKYDQERLKRQIKDLQEKLSEEKNKYLQLEKRHSILIKQAEKYDFLDDMNVANMIDETDDLALNEFVIEEKR